MTVILGLQTKLYYRVTPLSALEISDAQTNLDPTSLVLMENVRDLTRDGSTAEADITTRANNGFRQTAGTLKEFSLDFQSVYDDADANLTAFETAWLAGTELAIADMDGIVIAGGGSSKGIVSNVRVLNFTRNEALEEGVLIDITLKASGGTQLFVGAA